MPQRAQIGSLAIAAREAMAFARQGWLLRHDTKEPVLPSGVERGDDVVVLIHGLFATAGVLRPMRAALARIEHPEHRGPARGPGLAKRAGRVHTATFPYFPGPGIEELASRLARVIDGIHEDARVHLVGHSLGGIVARLFAQESSDRRLAQTISMASPFAGVPRAAWLSIASARDLDPSSPVLRRILVGSASTSVPHLSIVAGADTLVKAPRAHALPGGDVIVMEGRGHNTLLFDDETARVVERRVLERRRDLLAATRVPAAHAPAVPAPEASAHRS